MPGWSGSRSTEKWNAWPLAQSRQERPSAPSRRPSSRSRLAVAPAHRLHLHVYTHTLLRHHHLLQLSSPQRETTTTSLPACPSLHTTPASQQHYSRFRAAKPHRTSAHSGYTQPFACRLQCDIRDNLVVRAAETQTTTRTLACATLEPE